MNNCVFCKIIAGELDANKVYEDEFILAFMDLYPIREGQVLIIPKEHIDHFSDIPEDLATKVFQKAHQISQVIRKNLKPEPERMGLVVHGYGVAHAHMIVIPQYDSHDIASAREAEIINGQIVFSGKNLLSPGREKLDERAKLIRGALESSQN